MTTTATPTKDEAALYRAILKHPERFPDEVLLERPYDKQREMLRSIQTEAQVAVVGCNGSGKDWTAGRAVLLWLLTHHPVKVVVTGPTGRQVKDVVWSEFRTAWEASILELGGRMYETLRWQEDQQNFAVGFSFSDTPAAEAVMPGGAGLQGFHSPNLLVVVTEAHAMKPADINTLRRLLPKCLLMTGNPFVAKGPFYDAFHSRRDRYKTIQISAYDTPNFQGNGIVEPGMVKPSDVEQLRDEWGEDSAMFKASILGEFPEDMGDTIVVPLSVATAAVERDAPQGGDEPVILGVDVARFGRDRSVVARRHGLRGEIVKTWQGANTMELAGWVGRYIEDDDPDVNAVVVDETGVGSGVVDRLRELDLGDVNVIGFQGGSSPLTEPEPGKKRKFFNAVAEAWWLMREWFEVGSIKQNDSLTAQVSSRGYTIQSDTSIRLQDKEDMLKSPDEADAFAMTFAPMVERTGIGVYL